MQRPGCTPGLIFYADADALALVPTLEGLTEREDNHFTEDDALSAIVAYYDPIIHKLTRERIERH